MKIIEVENRLNWAHDPVNAEEPSRQQHEDFVKILVNVEDVFAKSPEGFGLDINDPSGGKNAIGNRLARAKQHFRSGGNMDLPLMSWNKYDNSVSFDNGRHRTAAAYQLGHEYVPALVYTDTLDDFKKHVRTKSL